MPVPFWTNPSQYILARISWCGGIENRKKYVALTGIKKIFVELHQNVIGRVSMKNVFDFMSSRDFHYDQHHSHGGVVLFSHVLR